MYIHVFNSLKNSKIYIIYMYMNKKTESQIKQEFLLVVLFPL